MSDQFDDADELAAGRGEIDATASPDWLILSGCSARGLQLYSMLKLRLNRRRRARKVWPGLAVLAVMMKLKTSESVSPYVKELEQLGAIDVEKSNTMPQHNIYRINFTPPPSYAGPMCIEDWDDDPAHKAAAQAIRAAEKAKREKTRAKTAKPQVKADPGKNPDQRRRGKTAPADPGKIRDQEPGKNPDLDPGFFGVEPLGVTEGVLGTLRTTPSPSETHRDDVSSLPAVGDTPEQEQETEIPSDPEHQEDLPETAEFVKSDAHWPTLTEDEQALLDEVVAAAPLWPTRALRKVIGSRTVREIAQRDPELVRRAFLIGAKDRETVPMRMWHVEHCPHWARAARDLAAERNPEPVPPAGRVVAAGTAAAPQPVIGPMPAAKPASGPNEEWRAVRAAMAARRTPAAAS